MGAPEGAGATVPAPVSEHAILAEAIRWAERGRPVFPLAPGEKYPAIKDWQIHATTDVVTLHQWFNRVLFDPPPPEYGLGLPTGNGLAVVDVDVPKGGEIDPGWPATLVARTRSGGWHLYFRVDREVPNSVGRIAKGVDVRGDGGLVVSPPTPGWKWANPGHEIAEIPYHMLVPARAGGSALEDWRPFEPAEDGVPEGMRNDYLARFCGWLIHAGLTDEDELYETVQRENERIVQPPLGDTEVRQIVQSIGRYR